MVQPFSVDVAGEEQLVIAHEINRTDLRKLNAEEVIGRNSSIRRRTKHGKRFRRGTTQNGQHSENLQR